MEVLEILSKLVSFNTIGDLQNKEIVDWIEEFLKEYNFKCTKIYNKNSEKMNLIGEVGESPIIGFTGHLDTVPINGTWNTNPFELIIKDNLAYGLGVCDMKGGIAAFLKAATNIDYTKLKNGLKLYFTFDEEFGFEGIKLLLEKDKDITQNVILAEPTDLVPVVANKGCMDFRVTFYGKSVHSSVLIKGKNAILEANKFINEIIALSENLKKEQDNMFEIPYATVNIGSIQGGDITNRVPDKCVVGFESRTINSKQNSFIVAEIENILKKYDADLDIIVNINPKINENKQMIKTFEQLTKRKSEAANYVTEASYMDNTNAIILGVGGITAHEINENIKIDKLEKLVEIYEKIIEKYCLN